MTDATAPSAPSAPSGTRVAVITGAGGGLGRAFAAALADAGWTIAALGRTRATLEETVAGLPGPTLTEGTDGPQHLAVVCDVTDEDSVRQAFDAVTDHL